MAFLMDNPLVTTNSPEQNKLDQELWEAEDLGGITEDNNRMPIPVVWLVLLTVLTAFAITFPLWGQRPTAAIYAGMIKDLDKPEIQSLGDVAAMAKIVALHQGDELAFQQERHPVTMDDLRALKPKIEALESQKVDLKDYTVVGVDVVLANFEGNYRADGSRERQQPWWDKGYTIDIFYVIAFFLGVTIVVKRLPPSSWVPTHGHEH
ncbi:MAG: hypothetical protein R8K20_08965 [Gallionellaceae bacterium]